MRRGAPLLGLIALACSSELVAPDGGPVAIDAGRSMDGGRAIEAGALDGGHEADPDAGPAFDCVVGGNPGWCIDVADCATIESFGSTAGHCPGPAEIQCCTPVPDLSTNPPIPDGYRLMMQSEVTTEMTNWAIAILRDSTIPMFGIVFMTFGAVEVLALVEWHPPDFNNSAIHRGVTLYVPIT